MRREEHLKADRERFGREFPEVHDELDSEFAVHGAAHRKIKHHLGYVMKMWENGDWGGDWNAEQVRAAIFHIIDDCGRLMTMGDWKTSDEMIREMRKK